MAALDTSDTVYIASFDIGKRNFAFCVEQVHIRALTSITNVHKKRRYLPDGTPTPEFACILDSVYKSGHLILMENVDLTNGCDKQQYLDPKIFVNMTSVLDRYIDIWRMCSTFVIEQQLGFGQGRNLMAVKLGQHCYSYFVFQFAGFRNIVEFSARNKTHVLGANRMRTKSKPVRKAWTTQHAMYILTLRNDICMRSAYETHTKKDDLGDVITQLQAYKYKTYVKDA